MNQLMERRGLWFVLSAMLMLPAIVYMVWSLLMQGTLLPLSIDYTGGTVWEMRFGQPVTPAAVRQVFVDAGFMDTTVFHVTDEQTVQAKFKNVDDPARQKLIEQLTTTLGAFEERSYRSVGPIMGVEVSQAAVFAIALASLLILFYIAFAFRQLANPFRYGVCAVVALLHDILVTLSFFCIMHVLAGWEIDALFLTAILTVIGYSVSDTIVVFDRIRENLRRYRDESFNQIANRSIVETAMRSLATHVTTVLTLVAILTLGGPTLQPFIGTLLVGITAGTFSSIFNATALLVAWEEGSLFHHKQAASAFTKKALSTGMICLCLIEPDALVTQLAAF